jgi:beta-fructofuranosidase
MYLYERQGGGFSYGLRQNERVKTNLTVEADSELELEGFGNELLELEITAEVGDATQFGVMVACSENGREQTALYYEASEKELRCDGTKSSIDFGRRNVEKAPFELREDEPLVLRVFVDRSVVEVYANDRQAIGRRMYPKLRGTGV